MISLGIDIGGTSAKLALIECPGGGGSLTPSSAPSTASPTKTHWTAQSPFYARPDTNSLVNALRQAVQGKSLACDFAGICVPGLLDRERRMITLSVNVPGLMNVTLDEIVRRAFGDAVPAVQIINDAVATATDAIAAKRLNGRVMSIAIGTGVGMGVLDDGIPLMIEGASPGHIGQIDVSIEGHECIGPDGGRGSLEGYIGVPVLVARYGSTDAFLQSADADQPPIRALVRAIRIGHAIYRPNHVLLVGGIGTRLRRIGQQIKSACDDHLTSVARPDWQLHFGEHDFHAAQGAARLAAIG
ncbi:MAG TPA: ROK family protein [Tepidisphaeraceae bacterium]|nr:ROK family protein [Tepidisphaeraceae bacterium]